MDFDIDDIRRLANEASFERGERYFEEGRVEIIEASVGRVKAVVEGTDDYTVEVDLDHGTSATCTCPYDWGGYCKHIVAVLLAMGGEEVEAMMAKGETELEDMEALVEGADPDELREFLLEEMEAIHALRARFIARFSREGSQKSVYDYKREIDQYYRESCRYDSLGGLDFSSFEKLAEIHLDRGDLAGAAKVYQALFESIADRMDDVDDSYGTFSQDFSDNLDRFVDCIKEANLDPEERKRQIEYLFTRSLKEPDYFEDEYDAALTKLCTSLEEIEHWEEVLKAHLLKENPEGHEGKELWGSRGIELVSAKLRMLRSNDCKEEFYDLIGKYHGYSPEICLWHAKSLMEDGEQMRSVEVAEHGLGLFHDYGSISLREFLSDIYRNSDAEKYRENLLWLFLHTRKWNYYDELKAISAPEVWSRPLSRIVDYLSENEGFFPNTIIQVYLKEGMYDQAIKRTLEARSLQLLRANQNELAGRYPDEYFQAYRELINSIASNASSRKHYREVASYLKSMSEVPGFQDEFREYVQAMRVEKRRRPAFIDEMKDL